MAKISARNFLLFRKLSSHLMLQLQSFRLQGLVLKAMGERCGQIKHAAFRSCVAVKCAIDKPPLKLRNITITFAEVL